ncbi:hypothetical protein AURDEDRAFT_160261 [Auricularia subglabra TFB-10046 SS5]|nr:hypothetical protein AURDEDRAFT_160261 [Auricularia subglabra TFB-10046 SS5]
MKAASHHIQSADVALLLCAPRLRTVDLPDVDAGRPAPPTPEPEAATPSAHVTSHPLLTQAHLLRYHLSQPPPNDLTGAACLPAVGTLTVVVSDAPPTWRVIVMPAEGKAFVSARDVLLSLYALLRRPMEYAELARYSPSFEHRSAVLAACKDACDKSGRSYNGVASLRRLHWFLGKTRLQGLRMDNEGGRVVFVAVIG